MSARDKLNSAYLIAAIVPVAVLGLLLQSWTVFAFVVMAIVGIATYSGGL
jgi:hypothetical protein